MRKSPNYYQESDCGQYYPHILPQITSNIQISRTNFSCSRNPGNNRLARLSVAIERRDLHDCLEVLEEAGFRSEIALFILGYIQQSLGVAS